MLQTGEWVTLQRLVAPLALLYFGSAATACQAQISFTSAVDLALQRSPRVLMARDDVSKAMAVLKETRDVYIPTLIANGGAGDSYGITLSVPTIFTANAQSLVFSAAQRDYVRAARKQMEAALLRSDAMKGQVEEDAAVAYLEVDHAQKKVAVLQQEYDIAEKLVATMEDRHAKGIETDLELKRTRRSAVETRLARLQAEDELAFLRLHLAGLLGLPPEQVAIMPETVPPASALAPAHVDLGLRLPNLSAQDDAEARALRASGEGRLRWMPQISFAAQYGRISPINGVSDFYNIHGEYNTFFGGVQFQFPLFDSVQRAHAHETMADASHALHELTSIENDDRENRLRLQHARAENETKAELAQINYDITTDELASALAQGNAARSGAPLMTPMEEDRAMLRERQLYLELLNAQLEVSKVQISLLRQTGELEKRIRSVEASIPAK